jgi:2-polyprenyl-3-methyl-5-hydroxy-6-metoxy-1,4-benzoquinol methylase
MPPLRTADLSDFVSLVDENGGDLRAAAVVERYYPIQLGFETHVDQSLDPFSDTYFEQQIDLYCEIAGRDLDQSVGELHHQDLNPLLTASNPTGLNHVKTVAEMARAITTMLTVTDQGTAARVLDLGAGHGLSSEIYAFTGCVVDALDIDINLGDLARARSARLRLPISRIDGNFDDLTALQEGAYDAAYFFQSFHHCLKPWDLIHQLRGKLKPDGVIAFTGEPIQTEWWKHWGIRLDEESLYVARGRGWFENGWSHEFIRACFTRNGMKLTFLTGGLLGGEIAVATATEQRRQEVISSARRMGLLEVYREGEVGIRDNDYKTISGSPTELDGRPAFLHDTDKPGTIVYGPYANLEPGHYEVTFLARSETAHRGIGAALKVDVTKDAGASRIAGWRSIHLPRRGTRIVTRRIHVATFSTLVEFRIHVVRGGWTISVPTVRRLDPAT